MQKYDSCSYGRKSAFNKRNVECNANRQDVLLGEAVQRTNQQDQEVRTMKNDLRMFWLCK